MAVEMGLIDALEPVPMDDIERERIKAYGRGWNAAMMGRKGEPGESLSFEVGYLDVTRYRRPGSHLSQKV